MAFRVFGVKGEEEEAEYNLRKARTGAGRVVVAMGHKKGPGAVRADVKVNDCRGASGARIRLGAVV